MSRGTWPRRVNISAVVITKHTSRGKGGGGHIISYSGISTEMSKVGLQLQPAPPAGRPRVAEKGGEITARPGTAADSTNVLQ